jgi:hypothetical protein
MTRHEFLVERMDKLSTDLWGHVFQQRESEGWELVGLGMGKLPGLMPASMKGDEWLTSVAVYRRPRMASAPPPPAPISEFDAWLQEQRDKDRPAPP